MLTVSKNTPERHFYRTIVPKRKIQTSATYELAPRAVNAPRPAPAVLVPRPQRQNENKTLSQLQPRCTPLWRRLILRGQSGINANAPSQGSGRPRYRPVLAVTLHTHCPLSVTLSHSGTSQVLSPSHLPPANLPESEPPAKVPQPQRPSGSKGVPSKMCLGLATGT